MPVVLARPRLAGFALLESLIAMTVLSASLAVAAAALIQTLQHVRRASERSAALRLATSLAEELRGLRRSDGQPLQAATGDPASPCAEPPVDCRTEALARQRLAEFASRITAALPAGAAGEVAVPDPARPEYVIVIAWPDTASEVSARLQLGVVT